ncbi:DVU_1555 family C-GCAxxG-C-C protein [Pleomorphomonas oryzae]|uniref:DVU_1555 family C-GCAxxG-C-C protein n=1 Tax=Pleomorphomonas oryzae TaxID=261934 RepID=UPI000406C35E|nr:DV_1555 family C-GCAxxG-C-C protein [Pleomorphomonas oryzae]
MNEDSFRVAELLLDDFKCSHILMRLALEAQGRDDPDLVRAMSGLSLGMGQGFNCGALSAGCCVIGYYAGRGGDGESEHPELGAMLDDFVGWFTAAATGQYGGINCSDIMKFDESLKRDRCPALIIETWGKIKETLADHGIDITVVPQEEKP